MAVISENSENSRRLWLFLGSLREFCRKVPGKFRENCWKIFPESHQMQQIPGLRAPGKANLPGTLGPHCRNLVATFRAGCFLKSTVPAFSSSFWKIKRNNGNNRSSRINDGGKRTLQQPVSCELKSIAKRLREIAWKEHANKSGFLWWKHGNFPDLIFLAVSDFLAFFLFKEILVFFERFLLVFQGF